MEAGHLQVFGARGTYPAAHADFARFGGNTTCFALPLADRVLVIDAGSGASALARKLMEPRWPRRIDFLFTHFHLDHVCGLPSFAPLYDPEFSIRIHLPAALGRKVEGLHHLFRAPLWPIAWDALGSTPDVRGFDGSLELGDVIIDTAPLHHPGGSFAYRLKSGGQAIVIATDHEHGTAEHDGLAALCEGARAVLYDAHFTPDEYPQKVGWGHSTWQHGLDLIERAGADRLLLTHHDPQRTDEAMDEILSTARRASNRIEAAREGLQVELTGQGGRN